MINKFKKYDRNKKNNLFYVKQLILKQLILCKTTYFKKQFIQKSIFYEKTTYYDLFLKTTYFTQNNLF